MAQKEVTENGAKKLIIYISVNCSQDPDERIQHKKRVEGIAKGSELTNKALMKAVRETYGQEKVYAAEVIPLPTRNLPSFGK